MIDILTKKLQSCIEQDIWNSDDSENSNLLISPKKDVVLEWTDTGFFEIKKEKVMFNNCVTGHTYCLRKDGTIDEWVKFQKWYLEGTNSKLFRTDVPLYREEIEIDSVIWDYTRWMRPGAGVGELTTHQVFSNPAALPDFLNDVIDIYYDALLAIIKVAEEYDDPRIPDITFRQVMKDDRGYYFINNFDTWNRTPHNVITASIKLGQMLIGWFGPAIPEWFLDDWTARASAKWNTLYE
jgi:hypothetical protein